MHLTLSRQRLQQDADGFAYWEQTLTSLDLPAERLCLILCDVWDRHWCRGASQRVDLLVPSLNHIVQVSRGKGVWIIHAPSETMSFYKDHPARLRMQSLPTLRLPRRKQMEDPALPIDDQDGGCDSGEQPWYQAWTRQHPAIQIDPLRDGISDDIHEIFSFIRQRDIAWVLIAGVHTNMCVLNRPFGIKRLVRMGIPVALVRDLTDAMYNPAMLPYVSHAEGTRLVVEYIEKFWCPTILSTDLLAV